MSCLLYGWQDLKQTQCLLHRSRVRHHSAWIPRRLLPGTETAKSNGSLHLLWNLVPHPRCQWLEIFLIILFLNCYMNGHFMLPCCVARCDSVCCSGWHHQQRGLHITQPRQRISPVQIRPWIWHRQYHVGILRTCHSGQKLAYKIFFLSTTVYLEFSSIEIVLYFSCRSTKPVALNMWHRVDISRTNRFGTLVVNTEQPVRGSSGVNTLLLSAAKGRRWYSPYILWNTYRWYVFSVCSEVNLSGSLRKALGSVHYFYWYF